MLDTARLYFFVSVPGVSKVVTVDIKGNWQHWLKIRDLTKGITYLFRVQARTITYGPELQANVTAGPAEGKGEATGDVRRSVGGGGEQSIALTQKQSKAFRMPFYTQGRIKSQGTIPVAFLTGSRDCPGVSVEEAASHQRIAVLCALKEIKIPHQESRTL